MIYAVVDQRPGKRARVSYPFDEGNMPGGWICTPNVALDLIGATAGMSLQDAKLEYSPPIGKEEVKDKVKEVLDRYRHTMRTLVTKAGRKPLLPPWIPTTGNGETAFKNHIGTLGIPSVQGMPSLLLHNLGSESDVRSQIQAKYIDKIFSLGRNKCVDHYDSLLPFN